MYNVITDTAEYCTTYLAQPARPHHDVARLLACRHVDYELARFLEVGDEFAPQLHASTDNTHWSSYTQQTRLSIQSINQLLLYLLYCKILTTRRSRCF